MRGYKLVVEIERESREVPDLTVDDARHGRQHKRPEGNTSLFRLRRPNHPAPSAITI